MTTRRTRCHCCEALTTDWVCASPHCSGRHRHDRRCDRCTDHDHPCPQTDPKERTMHPIEALAEALHDSIPDDLTPAGINEGLRARGFAIVALDGESA